ncbi:MAG TPA: hypothetical protein VK327_17880, partial [Candidatus Paceibacterota bacterium]|nr:hypothetical protein [Candidatus Paceibacterota bacterium]
MKRFLILFATLFVAATVSAQPGRTNAPNRIYRDQVDPHWFAGESGETNQFWYRVNPPGERREFVLVDAIKGTRLPAFDHERLAKALAQTTGKDVDAGRLPVN